MPKSTKPNPLQDAKVTLADAMIDVVRCGIIADRYSDSRTESKHFSASLDDFTAAIDTVIRETVRQILSGLIAGETVFPVVL